MSLVAKFMGSEVAVMVTSVSDLIMKKTKQTFIVPDNCSHKIDFWVQFCYFYHNNYTELLVNRSTVH